jgi:hypothetical protein
MRYRAFFSYARADDKLANWLHQALDTYRTPKALIGRMGPMGEVPAKLHPIFRDRTDLEAGGHVDQSLQAALEDSACLIVLCTPTSAKSRWVNEEVETFLRLGRETKIFPVIGAGEPDSQNPETECFPPALRGKGLLAADLREIRQSNGRMIGDGREGGRLKLIAGLLGVPLDELIQREKRRRAQQRLLALSVSGVFLAVAGAAIGLGLLANTQGTQIVQQKGEIESEKTRADLEAQEALRQREAAAAAAEVALQQYRTTNQNVFATARHVVGITKGRLSDKRVYFFGTPHFQYITAPIDPTAPPPANPFERECPRNMLKCMQDAGIEPLQRSSAVVFSKNTKFTPEDAGIASFRAICQRFENFTVDDLAHALCQGGPSVVNEAPEAGSSAVRFTSLPGDSVVILYGGDGTAGIDFGTFGEKREFEVWRRQETGAYQRIDDRTSSMQEGQHWMAGNDFALVTDQADQLIEAFLFDTFGGLNGGVAVTRFAPDESGILRKAASALLRETQTGAGLPPLFELETSAE